VEVMGPIIRFLRNYGSWENIAPIRNFPGVMLSQAIFHKTRDLLRKFSQEVSLKNNAIIRDFVLI
jgi:hypothetical protein